MTEESYVTKTLSLYDWDQKHVILENDIDMKRETWIEIWLHELEKVIGAVIPLPKDISMPNEVILRQIKKLI